MNICEKLQAARVELAQSKLHKSGKNDFAKYEYFELGDFMPAVNEIMLKLKMTSVLTFAEVAALTIYDSEKPEDTLTFTCPMSSADLAASHAVQNLGAVMTYLRRYLWMNAFEIVEAEALDKTQGKPVPQQTAKPTPAKPQQPQAPLAQAVEEKREAATGGTKCDDCGKPVTGYTTKAGKKYSVEDVIKFSVKDFGCPVCSPCSWKRKNPAEESAERKNLLAQAQAVAKRMGTTMDFSKMADAKIGEWIANNEPPSEEEPDVFADE